MVKHTVTAPSDAVSGYLQALSEGQLVARRNPHVRLVAIGGAVQHQRGLAVAQQTFDTNTGLQPIVLVIFAGQVESEESIHIAADAGAAIFKPMRRLKIGNQVIARPPAQRCFCAKAQARFGIAVCPTIKSGRIRTAFLGLAIKL